MVRTVRARRVLVSGMGGELGSQVAAHFERESWVGELLGLDIDPPRRRLPRSGFHLVDPLARDHIERLVKDFDPEIVVHFGVYEPDARASAREAARWTPAFTDALFGAAGACPSLAGVVVRSGIELYGRGGDRPDQPDESAPAAPTTPFGRELADVEARARLLGHERDVPVAALRLAPVLGPHVPSPLGRLLRLPVVPIDLLGVIGRTRFQVIDDRDVGRMSVAAARNGFDGAVNLAADDSITVRQALHHGRRLPIPIFGPQWYGARLLAHGLGAPVPAHVSELLARGRRCSTAAAGDLLGVTPSWSTEQLIDALYAWEQVVHVRPAGPSAFAAVEGS